MRGTTVPEWDVSLKEPLVQPARVLLLAPERFQHRKVAQDLTTGALGPRFQHFQDLQIECLDTELPAIFLECEVQRRCRSGAPGESHLAFHASQIGCGSNENSVVAMVHDPEYARLRSILLVLIDKLFAARLLGHDESFIGFSGSRTLERVLL